MTNAESESDLVHAAKGSYVDATQIQKLRIEFDKKDVKY